MNRIGIYDFDILSHLGLFDYFIRLVRVDLPPLILTSILNQMTFHSMIRRLTEVTVRIRGQVTTNLSQLLGQWR